MAATTIPSRPTAQTLINNLAPTDNSFLARTIRDLEPSKISTYNLHSKLWLVAAGVTFVAFTALAAGAFFYTGMFLPAYVPFAAIGALVSAMPVANFVKNFLEYSKASHEQSLKYQSLQDNFVLFNEDFSTLQLQSDLSRRGIAWQQIPGTQGNPAALSKLTPLLALALDLDDKMGKETESKQKLTNQARELAHTDFIANRQKIYELRSTALILEDKALETKVHAAFVNAVLRKSNYNGTLQDIATLTDVGYNERVLGDALGDSTGVSAFVTFKNRNIAAISYADVKRMSVAELGQRLVAAMA